MNRSEIQRRIEGVKVPRGIAWIGKPTIDNVFRHTMLTLITFMSSDKVTWRVRIQVTRGKCCLYEITSGNTAEVAALARYMKAIEKALEE